MSISLVALPPDQALFAVLMAAMSILSVVTLKLALRRQVNPTVQDLLTTSRRIDEEISRCQVSKVFLSRFTFVQFWSVRMSRFKINMLLSAALLAMVSVLLGASDRKNTLLSAYWACIPTTLVPLITFIVCEAYYSFSTTTVAVDADSVQNINWKTPLIYGSFTLTSVISFVFAGYYYSPFTVPNPSQFWLKFLGGLLGEHLVLRPLVTFSIATATAHTETMSRLRQHYIEILKYSEEHADQLGNNVDPCVPISPTKHRNKRMSPSKVPKIKIVDENNNEHSAQKPHLTPPVEMDSMISFLELSQKKRISRQSKLPPVLQTHTVTPKNKLKNHDSSIEKSLEVVAMDNDANNNNNNQNKIENIALDELCKEADRVELTCFDAGLKTLPVQGDQDQLNIRKGATQTQDLEEQLNTIQLMNRGASGQFPSEAGFDELDQITDYSIIRKRGEGRKGPLSDWSEDESEYGRNPRDQHTPFKIVEDDPELEESPHRVRERSQTLDPSMPLRFKVRNQNDSLGLNGNSVLQIQEQHLQNLEQVDLNSPIRRNSPNKYNSKETIPNSNHIILPKPKKRHNKKRDIKQLIKLNGASPYLEYLPNMLKKEMQNRNESSSKKGSQLSFQTAQDSSNKKTGRTFRRGTNPDTIHPLAIRRDNNQNICPDDFVQDFV